jgi:hypothetical protein
VSAVGIFLGWPNPHDMGAGGAGGFVVGVVAMGIWERLHAAPKTPEEDAAYREKTPEEDAAYREQWRP